jgi:serine/threonine-protein kinase
VAVKILRPELGATLGAERFLREIEVTAALQHPHILPLHDSGRAGELLYYVMPYVEGESLRERLARERQLPVDETVRIACDVAAALDYAHRRGVIHRDIKPENILLHDGRALVADFGIARAVQRAVGDDTLTGTGVSVGTPSYMSPEQAAADREVDARTDIYSLGCIVYEMLTGAPPFTAATAQGVIARVMTEEPRRVADLRQSVPSQLSAAVQRALAKLAADRFQTAAEFATAVSTPSTTLGSSAEALGVPEGSASLGPLRRRFAARDLAWAALAVVLMLAASALTWLLAMRRSRVPLFHAQLTLALPSSAIMSAGAPGNTVAISPDGSTLAYTSAATSPPRLFIRRLDEVAPHALPGTEMPANPQFSPDGRWIAFLSRSALRKTPVGGGPVTVIARDAGRFAWGRGGTIAFSRGVGGFLRGLWRVSENGGVPEPLTSPDSSLGGSHGSPSFLPDGKTVLFTSASRDGEFTLSAVRLDDRKVISLGIAGTNPIYLHNGYLVFARPDGFVSAVKFDAKALRAIGDPVPVLDSVALKPGGSADLSVATNGTVVYFRGAIGAQLLELDRRGVSRLVIPAVEKAYAGPRISPDGRRIAVAIGQPPYTSDIWLYTTASNTPTRVTIGGVSGSPEWTPDGRRIAWTSAETGHEGVWWQPWDQSAPAELLIPGGRGAIFTRRGDTVLTSVDVAKGLELRLVTLPYDARKPPRVVLPATPGDRQPQLSPDDRWLAYLSDETGLREVYVQAFPGPGGRFQISTGGGNWPTWSPSGRELFYVIPGCCVMSATLNTASELTILRRDTLFSIVGTRGGFDVTRDGNHFITSRQSEGKSVPVVVFGWADEVRERVDAANKK